MKILITFIVIILLFAFTAEKNASFHMTETEYNSVQSILYDVAISADSLDGSHKTVRRIQNNVVMIQQFLKEKAGKQFADSTKK